MNPKGFFETSSSCRVSLLLDAEFPLLELKEAIVKEIQGVNEWQWYATPPVGSRQRHHPLSSPMVHSINGYFIFSLQVSLRVSKRCHQPHPHTVVFRLTLHSTSDTLRTLCTYFVTHSGLQTRHRKLRALKISSKFVVDQQRRPYLTKKKKKHS